MKLIITNTDTYFLPLLSNCEDGWADTLAYNTPYELDRPETDVAILGDKPGWLESFKETLLGRLMATFIDRWHHRDDVTSATPKSVHAVISNEGEFPVLVTLGAHVAGVELLPGLTSHYEAPEYIELRELTAEDLGEPTQPVQEPHGGA